MLPLDGGMCKTTPPRVSIGVSIGAGVLTTCNWLSKLPKNLKLDFFLIYKYKLIYYNPYIIVICFLAYNKNIS
jgi:hypothetical protein